MGSGATENQIWVTYALSEEDVPKALTLCTSLRKVLTWRKVGVIVSQKLGSHPWRECLSEAFDFYFELEEHRNTKGLKENDFVKLFPLTLKSFEKILVLAPNMLVIKQCDKLFDEEQEGNGNQEFVLTRENGMSIFLVKPSPKIFNVLMTHTDFPRTNGNGTGWFHTRYYAALE
ncbi:unnamed protein product [Orchesella dallaii]|uniref:Uncharacterized protein n=1 Tax=Orchesella dallaii TaxID=48710 RepID=A0ABP1Q0U1_9HEXA